MPRQDLSGVRRVLTSSRMTLLEAVQSLALLELAAVSWIHIDLRDEQTLAVFMIALQLPFVDPALPEELRTGPVRMWPDQKRILVNDILVEDQIRGY